MKHLKTYENINEGPKIGDYVYCEVDKDEIPLYGFLKNNIGKLGNQDGYVNSHFYYVTFDEIINSEKVREMLKNSLENDYTIGFSYDEIVCWDEDLETLKLKINALKYNL